MKVHLTKRQRKVIARNRRRDLLKTLRFMGRHRVPPPIEEETSE